MTSASEAPKLSSLRSVRSVVSLAHAIGSQNRLASDVERLRCVRPSCHRFGVLAFDTRRIVDERKGSAEVE